MDNTRNTKIAYRILAVICALVTLISVIPVYGAEDKDISGDIKENMAYFIEWKLVKDPVKDLPSTNDANTAVPVMLKWKVTSGNNKGKEYCSLGIGGVPYGVKNRDNKDDVGYVGQEWPFGDCGTEFITSAYVKHQWLQYIGADSDNKCNKYAIRSYGLKDKAGYSISYDNDDYCFQEESERSDYISIFSGYQMEKGIKKGDGLVKLFFNVSGHQDPGFRWTDKGAVYLEQDSGWDNYDPFELYVGTPIAYRAFTQNITIGKGQSWNFNPKTEGGTLILSDVTLTIEEGATVWLHGRLYNNGKIINKGTLILDNNACIETIRAEQIGTSSSGAITCDGGDIIVLSGAKLTTRRGFGSLSLKNGAGLLNCGDILLGSMTRVEKDSHIENRENGLIMSGFGVELAEYGQAYKCTRILGEYNEASLSDTFTERYSGNDYTNVDKTGFNLLDRSSIVNYGTFKLANALYTPYAENIANMGDSYYYNPYMQKNMGGMLNIESRYARNMWTILKTQRSARNDFDDHFDDVYTSPSLSTPISGGNAYAFTAKFYDYTKGRAMTYEGVGIFDKPFEKNSYSSNASDKPKLLRYFPFCTTANGFDVSLEFGEDWSSVLEPMGYLVDWRDFSYAYYMPNELSLLNMINNLDFQVYSYY